MTFGRRTNDDLTTSSTTEEFDRFIEKIHPNARKNIKIGAKYISSGRRSYDIVQNSKTGFWKIEPYYGGKIAEVLTNQFTSFKLAEATLIQYLRSKDKWGRAFYPGMNG